LTCINTRARKTRTIAGMRKDKAALRNALILGATIVGLVIVTIFLARNLAG